MSVITHEARLLDAARRMPEARNLLAFIQGTMFTFWCDVLRLPGMDREEFVARALASWERHSRGGVTLDAFCLAPIVMAAAKLDLTHANKRLLARLAEVSA